jgi:hypothetical protein
MLGQQSNQNRKQAGTLCNKEEQYDLWGQPNNSKEMEGRGALDIQNANNGELTPGEKSTGT